MTYEFYQGLRVSMFICCVSLIIGGWRIGLRVVLIPLAILALLFSPIIEFQFERDVWVLVDALAALILVLLAALAVWLDPTRGNFKNRA